MGIPRAAEATVNDVETDLDTTEVIVHARHTEEDPIRERPTVRAAAAECHIGTDHGISCLEYLGAAQLQPLPILEVSTPLVADPVLEGSPDRARNIRARVRGRHVLGMSCGRGRGHDPDRGLFLVRGHRGVPRGKDYGPGLVHRDWKTIAPCPVDNHGPGDLLLGNCNTGSCQATNHGLQDSS